MMRGGVIKTLLTTDKSTLQSILNSGGSQSDGSNPYAAGYVLLRYLAKQGQGQSISKVVTEYNESYSPTPPKNMETGVEIDFSSSTTADGSALTVPDSFDGQGFCILCKGCSQYINIVFDKSMTMGTGSLKSTQLTIGTYRRDYTIGIGGATSTDDLAKAIFEGISNASGRNTAYDVYVDDGNGNKELACVSIDSTHNLRIAKNPNYPNGSNSEYIFLKEKDLDMLFMEGGTIEATGGVGSKDDAPDGTATKILDKYGNEIFDENENPIPHEQVIKVDDNTPVQIWEAKFINIPGKEGNPLVIHSGTQAGQNTHFFINDMQTKSLTAGKIFDADSDAKKTERTLIHESDRARFQSLGNDVEKQQEWLELLKEAENMSIDDISVTTVRDANIAIRVLDGALEYALDNATTLGSYLQRLEATENNIVTTEENTTAAESTIRDADMAKEMTEYTKMNMLVQASQSMLAQANHNASGILDLLR